MTDVPTVTLNNGVEIPQLGFGVFQIKPDDARDTVLSALEVGYRHIDTAQMYRNEKQVGEAVRDSGIDRSEIFVTSKLNNGVHTAEETLEAFETSLDTLGFDYLDLFLVHWPMPETRNYVEVWRAFEDIYRSGRARAIGVSNFTEHHLRRLHTETTVVPAVNQVELHPYLAQDALRAFDSEHGIATEAWSPIGQGTVLGDPVLVRVASEHDRTPAQVVLRWHLQRGDIVFPKSVTRARIEENFALFDFELSAEDMAAVSALDKGGRIGPHPEDVN
ncbi:aldo/keto reductase [Luteimicrobium subarcticum]|uniref:2,5-diketo-D-gluconate reductase A n=1 Tax=Luteimicrobium subarcticum TaxID=620910 RepID=A0A2M8WSY3_9MICO|nr:aldo/keto reductase [Luteimicrobium subarcticum]PJI94061.1 2,5-diketo-D-gluconate reductase A [Luteimicrobium subarcticum]